MGCIPIAAVQPNLVKLAVETATGLCKLFAIGVELNKPVAIFKPQFVFSREKKDLERKNFFILVAQSLPYFAQLLWLMN